MEPEYLINALMSNDFFHDHIEDTYPLARKEKHI
jgi:hypothetical protein